MSADSTTPGLHWSIKRSFVLYVARIADGEILGSPGLAMADAATFVWAPAAPSPTADLDDDAIRMGFTGAVLFGAHGGALSFRVADPQIEIRPDRSVLFVTGESGGAIPFVTFAATSDTAQAGPTVWHGADVRLTEEALPLFAGYYGAGESFDDLSIVESSGP